MLKALCSRMLTGLIFLPSPKQGQVLKLLRIMRITAFILLVGCLQVAANGDAQGVTISLKNAPLEKVFSQIEKQSGYSFVYTQTEMAQARRVDLDVKQMELEKVLALCFKDQPLSYTIRNKFIVVKRKTDAVGAPDLNVVVEEPPIDVKGKVTNEKGEPVAGVTVTVKVTNKATSTDDKGEFILKDVSDDAVLVFTSVNMESFEIKVAGRSDLDINLRTKIAALGGVNVQVNTGYQRISKERFIGSFSQLDSQNFHRRVGMNIIDRLDGTVPGIFFNKKGGTNFSPIQIRGISTLGNANTSTEPLIIVDDFPMGIDFNINSINPNDVENITVLKDAAAASIWGSRAGNGVIVVTTKKGRYNQRLRMSVSSNVTIQEKPDLFYYPRVSPSDFVDIEQFLFNKGFYDANINDMFTYPVISPVVEILARKNAGLLTDAEATTQIDALRNNDLRHDLNQYVYREAVRQQHYLGFSGGTNILAYQFSVGYNRSLNNIQGSKGDDQYTINTNTSFQPVKNLEIRTGIDLALNKNRSNDFSFLETPSPYARLVDDNGKHLDIPRQYRQGYIDTAGDGKLLDWTYRPLDEIRLADINTTSKFIRLNVSAAYRFTSWLTANVSYLYQNSSSNTWNYKSLQTWETRDLINRFTDPNQTNPNLRYPVPLGGILEISHGQSKNYSARGTLNFSKSWGTQHQLTALAGGEVSDSKGGYGSSERLYGYDNLIGSYRTSIDYFNVYPRTYAAFPNSVAFIPNNNSYIESGINRFVSGIANAAYTFRNRYNLYVSARKDGANIFGVNTNNKWKPLWSAGAGWDISKERFYSVSWAPSLRLRASYGYTGNANNTLSGKFIVNYSLSPDEITRLPFSRAGRAPNPDLRWEEVRIGNFGIDYQLLENRISGSLEVFHKQSKDVIADASMPPTSGVFLFTLNYASMKTSGYELTLNSRNTKGLVEWSSNFGWSHAKTEVTNLSTSAGHRASDFTGYSLNAVPGQIVYGISSYRWAGLDPATGDPQGYLNKQVSKDYQGIFDDSIQNQIFHGSSLPLSSGYIRNNISWKGFTLSGNITGRFNYYFREPALNLEYSATMEGTNYSADYYKRWQKPGDEKITNVPSMLYPVPSGVSQRNTFYTFAEIHVKRADNIRLQDVSVSYKWTSKNNTKLPFQSIQFFFYPNNLNLILWRADDSRFDPDFSGGSGIGINAPSPKTWTGGVTLNF